MLTLELLSAHQGEVLALITAVAWAVAVILFKKSGEVVHPIGLNLFKNSMAVVLLVPTIWIAGETVLHDAPLWEYGLLLLSGALGIGAADTLFFKSLNLLGAGPAAIVLCLYSPVIITLSIIFLGESLSVWQLIGASVIATAVLIVPLERGGPTTSRANIIKGILYGATGQLLNGIGIVMIKPLLTRSPILWVTEIRLVGGTIILALILPLYTERRAIIKSILARQAWGYTLSGSFVGAYVAMILWLGGMKLTQASTASALNQTSSLFIFLFAWMFLKEPITAIRTIGLLAAVAGTLLVTFG